MSSLNKLICFFSTKYYNNLKYNNRMLSATRIFFERTTKFTQTVSNLGNVYRNSKWSDLSVQNIKLGGVQQFITLFINLIIALCLIFMVLRGYFNTLGDILFLLTNILYVIQDFTYYIILIIISLFYSLVFKLNLLLSRILPFFFTVEHPNNTSSELRLHNIRHISVNPKLKSTADCNLNSEASKHNDMLLAALFLQKTLTLLPKLDYTLPLPKSSTVKLSSTSSYASYIHIILHNSSNSKLSVRTTTNPMSVLRLENKLLYHYSSKDFSKVTTLSLNYGSLFNLAFSDFKVLSDNLKTNLILSKQAKWFWKSTLLSDKFSLGVLPITNLKKLYGNPSYNNNSTSYNTWNSNRLTSQKNFLKVSSFLTKPGIDIDFTKIKTPILGNNAASLNSYETSIFWLIKKFSFLNSSKANQTYIDFNLASTMGAPYRDSNTQVGLSNMNLFFLSNHYFQKGFVLDLGYGKTSTPGQCTEQAILSSTSELFSVVDMEFVRYMSITTLPHKCSTLYYSNIDLS